MFGRSTLACATICQVENVYIQFVSNPGCKKKGRNFELELKGKNTYTAVSFIYFSSSIFVEPICRIKSREKKNFEMNKKKKW